MNQVNGLVLQVLYRGFCVLYRKDSRVREEVDGWDEGLTLKLVCGPGGAVLTLRKDGRNGIEKLQRTQHADITMRFKSVEGAFRVLSGQIGVADAYAAHLFYLEGDIYKTMSFVRCVEYIESYLFPKIISERILKEVPEKQISSLQVYALALLER
jgi:hypothetical protein